jgi:MOSC domain-containing protein YiiM
MEQVVPGLRDAMDRGWGGGAFAEVLIDGSIAVGDTARWSHESSKA